MSKLNDLKLPPEIKAKYDLVLDTLSFDEYMNVQEVFDKIKSEKITKKWYVGHILAALRGMGLLEDSWVKGQPGITLYRKVKAKK